MKASYMNNRYRFWSEEKTTPQKKSCTRGERLSLTSVRSQGLATTSSSKLLFSVTTRYFGLREACKGWSSGKLLLKYRLITSLPSASNIAFADIFSAGCVFVFLNSLLLPKRYRLTN
jgi:hypothetical protein